MNKQSLLATLELYSPYLWRLHSRYPAITDEFYESGAHTVLEKLNISFPEVIKTADSKNSLMRIMREQKAKLALLTAIADITGKFTLAEVTQTLSEFADTSVSAALSFILREAEKRDEITLPNQENPQENSGIFIIGMGKLGAFELNYSSDIDLIILFENNRLNVRGRLSEQAFMNRLAHDLVFIMQERTTDGYVFRTDLRLRPDPSSTPPVVSVPAAMAYYEGVGQNWERAAMIKARAIAGDKDEANAFLKYLTPFMWRRTLDFAAIQDILSIKRQMDHREGDSDEWLSYNVKLGKGGIREVEFFVQIHQLIWGGKNPILRTRETIAGLKTMLAMKLIDEQHVLQLEEAYIFLRTLEHRLQMVDDQQTHTLPKNADEFDKIARFMGLENSKKFEEILEVHSQNVHSLFTDSFKSQQLSADTGNLVFTGVTHDPNTVSTLKKMGYENAETVSEIIMGWHHGKSRATRTKRSREVLTELVPEILKVFSKTPRPDESFLYFDSFVASLPAGVQLFSLFLSNPKLLGLLARLMGTSPYLKEHLIKYPELIESVLIGGFYDELPNQETLKTQLLAMLKTAEDYEDQMEILRQFKNEKQFQAGVQFLNKMCNSNQVGSFLANVAEVIVAATLECVSREFERTYGNLPKQGFAIIALGRLGSKNMTFASDIDVVFVYDVADFEALSSGEKKFSAGVYFNRLSQRFLSALTTTTKNGALYEVDTRLRPSGKQGLLAVSLKAFSYYFSEMAWTFEEMALTKARVIAGEPVLSGKLAAEIKSVIMRPRDLVKLGNEVNEMRVKTEEEFPAKSVWDLKYIRGGLMDADFIAQYLILKYTRSYPEIFQHETRLVLEKAIKLNLIEEISSSYEFLENTFQWLRLMATDVEDMEEANANLKSLITNAVGYDDFEKLKEKLLLVEKEIFATYLKLLTP